MPVSFEKLAAIEGMKESEGYPGIEEYKAIWQKINKKWMPELEVFVISFERVL
jgi:hypothetical protein